MRVLLISGEFPPMQGGVGDCTNEIAKGLARLGVEPHVLTTAVSLKPEKSESKPAVSALDQGRGGEPECNINVHRIISKWSWSILRRIRRAVRELAPAVVHIQYQTGAYDMHPAINFLPWAVRTFPPSPLPEGSGVESRPRVITTFHDLRVPYLFPKAGPLREWVNRFLARSSDAVVATNEEDYGPLDDLALQRLALIPIGSNIPNAPPPDYRRADWRAQLGVAEGTILLCYFGFLNESKGGETLIRALAQIPGAKLLMIGGQVGASDPTNVAYRTRVLDLIAELRLNLRVMWTDYTAASEVSASLLASDICVLPYRDGASYRRGSFMAALAHGLPIVTTSPAPQVSQSHTPRADSGEREADRRTGHLLPALRGGDNVMLVPPDDPAAIADAISYLVARPELRVKLSSGARQLAEYFTWDEIAKRHLEFYRLLTAAGPQQEGLFPRGT